jgi:hypothetical protein
MGDQYREQDVQQTDAYMRDSSVEYMKHEVYKWNN